MLLRLILVVASAIITTACGNYMNAQSQSSVGINTGASQLPARNVEGKVAGEVAHFKKRDESENLRSSLLSQPVPEVWLVFPVPIAGRRLHSDGARGSEPGLRVELPPEGKHLLSSHWLVSLTYRINIDENPFLDAESRKRESIALGNSFLDTARKLSQLKIDAPDGRRNISQGEAFDLAEFIGTSANKVFQQAKSRQDEP